MVTRQNGSTAPAARPAFTLLEVLLATAIAVLLLAALYVAVDVQIRHAQAGRDVVEQAALSRTIMKRITTDVQLSIALTDPARFRSGQSSGSGASGASGASGTTPAAANAATTPAASTTTPATGATSTTPNTGTSTIDGSTTSLAVNANTQGFPLGIQGTADQLNIFISRVPREALLTSTSSNAAQNANGPQNGNAQDSTNSLPMGTTTTTGVTPWVVADVRRISYWLVGGNDSAQGLARLETKLTTSDDITNLVPPNIDNEADKIIAAEVRSLTFEYWNGTDWQDTWDCTTLGADGITPIGSPTAIAVTIGLSRGEGADVQIKTFRKVIAINSANGNTPQPAPATTTP